MDQSDQIRRSFNNGGDDFQHAFSVTVDGAGGPPALSSDSASAATTVDFNAGTPAQTATQPDTQATLQSSSAVSSSYSGFGVGGSSLLTPSTFDPDSMRRSLVDIPRGMGFTSTHWNYRRTSGASATVREEDGGTDEEDHTDTDDGYTDDELNDDALARIQRGIYSTGNGSSSIFGGGMARFQAEYGVPSRANSMDRSRMPLLGNPSMTSSPMPPYSASSSSSPASASALHTFTPASRRKLIRAKIERAKMSGEERRIPRWITRKRVLLCLAMVALIASYAMELVLRKVVSTNLYPYRWFLFQSICFLTALACTMIAIHHRVSVAHFVQHHGIPYRFLILSSLTDAIHSLSLVIAIGALPGSWGIIASQLTVPFSLLFRFFVTNGERCGITGLIGSIGIILGAGLYIIPDLVDFACRKFDSDSDGENDRQRLIVNLIILVIGLIPNAVSHIYKQSYLQHHSMNIYFMNLALSVGQLFWGLIFAPLALALQGSSLRMTRIIAGHATNSPSESLLAPATPPFTIPAGDGSDFASSSAHTPTGELGDFTSDMGFDIWRNGMQAIKCIAGVEAEQGDGCKSLYPLLSFELFAFLLCMSCSQLALLYLMPRVKRENVVALILACGVLAALVLIELSPIVELLLPIWDFGRCLPMDRIFSSSLIIAALSLVIGGLVVGQWQPSQEPMDLDVWARLEEFHAEEDLEQFKRTKRNTIQMKTNVNMQGGRSAVQQRDPRTHR